MTIRTVCFARTKDCGAVLRAAEKVARMGGPGEEHEALMLDVLSTIGANATPATIPEYAVRLGMLLERQYQIIAQREEAGAD